MEMFQHCNYYYLLKMAIYCLPTDCCNLILINSLCLFSADFEHRLINFALIIVQDITAVVVENCEVSCTFRKITDDLTLSEFEFLNQGIDTGLYLGNDIRKKLIELSSHLMFTVFYKSSLFNGVPRKFHRTVGNIIGVKILENEDNLHNMFW